MPVFRRLRQALGIKVEEKFDDESIPVSLSDRLFWVPFGSRYYRQVQQRAWLVPLLLIFLIICWLIGSIVTSWVYCAECRACRLAIPEGKCGTVLPMDQGDLFCLRSGWTGFSPRLGKTQSVQVSQVLSCYSLSLTASFSQGKVHYRHPQDVSLLQEQVMGLKSDWPCLRKLMTDFYFPGGFEPVH